MSFKKRKQVVCYIVCITYNIENSELIKRCNIRKLLDALPKHKALDLKAISSLISCSTRRGVDVVDSKILLFLSFQMFQAV
jgi:hypothetical protein